SLAATLGFLAASPASGKTLFGIAPLLGLDPLAHEGDRAAGPFTAIWLVIFAWPLFVFTPDRPRQCGILDALPTETGSLSARSCPSLRLVHVHRARSSAAAFPAGANSETARPKASAS